MWLYDEVIPLPSGTEISVEAARGDLARAILILMDGGFEAEASDLQHVSELIEVLAGGITRLAKEEV